MAFHAWRVGSERRAGVLLVGLSLRKSRAQGLDLERA